MPIGKENISPLTFQSLQLLDKSQVKWGYSILCNIPVAEARNAITHGSLLDPTVTHLMWIDSDMVFPADSLNILLKHDKPFIGGLCHDRRHPYKPVICREFDKSWGYEPGTWGWLFDFPTNEVIWVDGTGGAFLLIKREVFDAISKKFGNNDPNWKEWWTPYGIAGQSEDLSFCCRARESGFDKQLFVDTGLDIGHIGEIVIDTKTANRNRIFAYRQWYPALDSLIDAIATEPMKNSNDMIQKLENKKPIVSIIIPTLNTKPEFLIAAVKSACAQTITCEVIVVDDGSKKDVFESTRKEFPPTVKVIQHPHNLGIAAALNTGIVNMTTDWFCWLSSDDLFDCNKIECQLAALLSSKRMCGFHGYNLNKDNGNSILHVATLQFNTMKEQNSIISRSCVINGSTVMIHKDVFDAVGPFNTSFKYGQDWEMWCRIGRQFHWHSMPDKLGTRRELNNLTSILNNNLDSVETQRRNAEDGRIQRMYAVQLCTHCGEPIS
jgi:teichuronic acid biosynthesis glycosyltransferase TuaG